MRRLLGLFCCLMPVVCAAASLPDNIYFKAMKDEMQRSVKKLRLAENPKPYYIAYKLEHVRSPFRAEASLGAVYESAPSDILEGTVIVSAGNDTHDSLDIADFGPTSGYYMANSYDGIRQDLWWLTDRAYVNALDAYKKKQTYYRQKNITDLLPDVVAAKQDHYVEDILSLPEFDFSELQQIVKRVSALGKEYPYIENFRVSITPSQKDVYYLNSRGGFYQYSRQTITVTIFASFRTKTGFKKKDSAVLNLIIQPDNLEKAVISKASQLLSRVQSTYESDLAEPYLGPVLLKPEASAELFERLFVPNVSNLKPLISLDREQDSSVGGFKDKVNMRVMSNVVDVYDIPFITSFGDSFLYGFSPIDDEGVRSERLTLVSNGYLRQLPLSSRPLAAGNKSNGHSRGNSRRFPREQITNIMVEAKNPLSEENMEQKLRERCQELEMEYCYLMEVLPIGNATSYYTAIWRVYTEDGYKEPADGLKIQGLTARTLRDIIAAGDDYQAIRLSSPMDSSIIIPSLLIEEMELIPTTIRPDRKPFLPRP